MNWLRFDYGSSLKSRTNIRGHLTCENLTSDYETSSSRLYSLGPNSLQLDFTALKEVHSHDYCFCDIHDILHLILSCNQTSLTSPLSLPVKM